MHRWRFLPFSETRFSKSTFLTWFLQGATSWTLSVSCNCEETSGVLDFLGASYQDFRLHVGGYSHVAHLPLLECVHQKTYHWGRQIWAVESEICNVPEREMRCLGKKYVVWQVCSVGGRLVSFKIWRFVYWNIFTLKCIHLHCRGGLMLW